jgi:DNA polymerase-3 subunit alpha
MTRRGKMAFVALDDGSARVEVSVFSELFDANRDLLKEDQLLIVEGKVSKDDYSGGMRVVAERVLDLAGARTQFAKALRLSCNGQASSNKLMEILSPYRVADGAKGSMVRVSYRNGAAGCDLHLGEAWRVHLHDNLLTQLADWLAPENVAILYQ